MLGYDAVKDVSVSIIKLITASNPTYHCLHLNWKHYSHRESQELASCSNSETTRSNSSIRGDDQAWRKAFTKAR